MHVSAYKHYNNCLIGSRQGLLHVYSRGCVAWVARADAPPVALAVATLGTLPGVLCTLSADGVAVAGYLGTDASDMDGLTAVHVRICFVVFDL